MKLHLHRWFPVLFAALLLIGCAKKQAAEEEHHPAPVKVVKAETIELGEWLEVVGTTQPLPDRVARVSAPVEGRLVSLLRDANGKQLAEGQQIEAGTVLAQLDTRIIAEQKRQAEFAVRQAEIEVNRLTTLSASVSTNGKMPLVSAIELQKARIALEDVQSRHKSLEEQMKLYTLTSPIAGRLGLLQVVPGQTLTIGAPVADVVDLSEIDALCNVPPHLAARLALEQAAKVATAQAAGKVVFIAVQAQADTGNFAVKVRFPNADLKLRANAVVRVRVLTSPEEKRLTIPEAALMEDQVPPIVVVVRNVETKKKEGGKEEKLGKAKKLVAVLGVRDRERHIVEILGLEDPEKKEKVPVEGALFVTEGAYGLHNDDVVELEEEHK